MNLGEMETEVREMFGFPNPVTGGVDKLVQATIWKYINDAFSNMVNAIDGIEKYIEFTVQTDWTLTVTVGSATLSLLPLAQGDHQAIKIADLRTWGELINLTEGSGQPRSLRRTIFNERGWKSDQVSTQNYFDEYDVIPLGLILIPRIDQTNRLGLYYRKVATEMTLTGDEPDAEIKAEYHNKYPILYAAKMLCLSKDDTRLPIFNELAGGKDRSGNYTGALGEFVDDYQFGDLGTESHTVENASQTGEYFVR